MSTPNMRLGKYIQFKGSIYQQVAADTSVTPVDTLKEDVRILKSIKKAQQVGGVVGRAGAEEVLTYMFKTDPHYAPDDAEAYVGKGDGSKWQAFLEDDETITFEHENGKRYVFTQPR